MKDRAILRALASELAEIAALPVQRETARLWTKLNMLKPERPMVIIDQIPWHEMDIDGDLTLQCCDTWNRYIEEDMRRTLYKWKHMRGDMVVEPFIRVPQAVKGIGYGVTAKVAYIKYDEHNETAKAQHYEDILKTDEDIENIKADTLSYDIASQQIIDERYHEVFHGLLPLIPGGVNLTFQFWDFIAMFRGVEPCLYDIIDRPEFIHRTLQKFTDAAMSMITQLEAMGKLEEHPHSIHCTGANFDWKSFDAGAGKTSARNSWTFAMSQMLSTVSPAMHEEFEFAYLEPIFERFGNVYYGCCEPLHGKIDMIRKYSNVRKISMSPWADIDIGSQKIGRDYVVSNKPNPAFVAKDSFSEEEIQNDLQHTYAACRRSGSPLEFIFKDISTVKYKPQRLWQWADIAMRVAKQ